MFIINALASIGHLVCLNNDLDLGQFLSIVDLVHHWPNLFMHLWWLVWLLHLWYLVDLCLYAWSLLVALSSFIHCGDRISCLISEALVDALFSWTWLRLEHAFVVAYLVLLPCPYFGWTYSFFLESCRGFFLGHELLCLECAFGGTPRPFPLVVVFWWSLPLGVV